ncbi:MAG TPA: hypothetical protein VEO53_07260, partial [Candidatus Binatia bacterium]|nr:hypothetical protein [Candidatus Binatia bacterium]
TGEQTTNSAGVTWLLRGDAGQRALIAWHLGWEPAKQISGQAWMARFLAELLVDPYSSVRYLSQRSLKRLPGFEQFSYDFIGPEAERSAARQRALEIWRGKLAVKEGDPLRSGAGELLPEDKIVSLLGERDDRAMELLE